MRDMLEELAAHARLPIFVDVRRHALGRPRRRLGQEESGKLVCHIDELGVGVRHERLLRIQNSGTRADKDAGSSSFRMMRSACVKISNSSPRTSAMRVMPAPSAVRMASAVGAEMAMITGLPT